MAKRIWMPPGLVLSMVVSVGAQRAFSGQQPVEHHVVPLKTSSKLATDKRYETVSGDPTKAGAPFVIRIHAEARFIIMPHTHLVDENIVVVKGSWALGIGERFNRDTLEPMEVGDYGFAARKMAHFALSKSETIIQVHGIGPFMTQWVVPMYELADKGILLKTSAGDPGRLVPTSPEGCFALKLGARARPLRRGCGRGCSMYSRAAHAVPSGKARWDAVLGTTR